MTQYDPLLPQPSEAFSFSPSYPFPPTYHHYYYYYYTSLVTYYFYHQLPLLV